jgi:GNAT superfamily N-acetyltransferase
MADAPPVIRRIEPDDKAGLTAASERLSDESRYRRFLSPHGRLSAAELRYLREVDHDDHEALVTTDPATGEGVGVARYVRDAERADSAEIAVAVADHWQGRGVGTELLHHLPDRAREEGMARFTALMLADDRPMMHLLGDLGAARRRRVAGRGGAGGRPPATGLGAALPGWLRSAARGALRLPG